ncbi:hypothetical protein GGF46_004841 [Coemansia sp. RSA 552]|nr:hypothetical protein GGF46_004841 [Coemansia sp. RSA 552]
MSSFNDFIDNVKEKVDDTFQKVNRRLSHHNKGEEAADNAKQSAENAGESAKNAAQHAGDKAHNAAQHAGDKAHNAADAVGDKLRPSN